MTSNGEHAWSWNMYKDCVLNDITTNFSGKKEGSNLYDVQTIGEVCPGGFVTECPVVSVAQAENQAVAVAVDGLLTILEEAGQVYNATIDLGCCVDALCLAPDGRMLIAADRSGVLHFVSSEAGKHVFSRQIVTSDAYASGECNSTLFCSVSCVRGEDGLHSISVGLCSGRFFIFSDVDLVMLEKAHDTKNAGIVAQVQDKMRVREYDASADHTKCMTGVYFYDDGFRNTFYTTGCGERIMTLWQIEADTLVTLGTGAPVARKVHSVKCDLFYNTADAKVVKAVHVVGHLYTLDCMGCLHQWNAENLMLNRSWDDMRIIDFTVKVSSFVDTSNVKLFAIAHADSNGSLEFRVYDLPSMKQCYSSKFKKEKCYSLAMCPPNVDNVIFVDGTSEFSLPGSGLFMHCVVEASPDDRLIRLLSNRRFEEAEKFAITFGLDTQQVYRQKAVFLSNCISAVAEDALETTYERLKDCLMKVSDPATVGEICLEAMVPDVQMSYELLALGGARLREVTGRRMANGGTLDHEEDLKVQIINRIDRLVTFRMIHDASMVDADSGDEWLHFCNADLADEMTRLLATGNIQAAAIVLLRHKSSFLSFLATTRSTSEDNTMAERRLQAFLECIPQNADLNSVVSWLEDSVVPTILSKLSFGLPVISSWLLARAESFEQYDPDGWPENGLKIANVLFNVQSKFANAGFLRDQVSCVKKAFKSTSTEVANLRLLASRLQLLLQLKQKYQCNITLTEFIQETTMSLTYRMLDRVMVPELIVPSLERTVGPYMREHGLNEEEVLLGYVEDLLSRCQNRAGASLESLKERKVVAIVKCMKRPLMVLKATVKLAKKALVPWSQDISDLVENGLKLCSIYAGTAPATLEGCHSDEDRTELKLLVEPFGKELEYRKHVERLPSILAEYGLSKVEVSAHKQIIRFLVCRDTPEAMLQAFHFCHTFTTFPDIDVYRYRLMFLLRSNRVNDCVELLKTVKESNNKMAMSLLKHSIAFAESMLARVDPLFETERLTYCNVAIQLIKCILHDLDDCDNTENRAAQSEFESYLCEELDVLSNIMTLQTKYGELLTVEQYVSKPHRARVLSKHISKLGLSTETAASVLMVQENSGDSTVIDTGGAEKASKNASQDVHVDVSHVLNIARILGVESDQLQEQVAVHMSKKGKRMAKSALGVCRELIEMSPLGGAAETTIRVVLELLRHPCGVFSSDMKLVSEVLEAAAMALTFLDSGDISRAIQLNLFLTLLDEVNRVTDSDDDLLFCQQGSTSKNPFKTLSTLHPWMEQRGGLMLRLQQIVPLLGQMTAVFSDEDFMECRYMSEAKVADSVSNLRSMAMEMATVLKHGQQSQLAFQWLVFFLRTIMYHMVGKRDLQDGDKNMSGKLQAIVEEGAKILPEYVEDTAQRVLGGSKEVDVGYVVGLLTMVPMPHAQSLLEGELKRAASNYKRIMNVTSAGIAMLKLNSMQSQVKKYQHLFLDSKWGETLRPLKISFEKVLFSPPNLKSCLLPNMLHHPQITGKIVNEFCIDYGLDRTTALLDFTRVLLSDPSCTITQSLVKTPTHAAGGRQLVWEEAGLVSPTTLATTHFNITSHVHTGGEGGGEKEEEGEPRWNRPWQEVKTEIAYVMNNIGDRLSMCRQLIRILHHETSPYYYKRIKFILNLIAECNTVQSEVNVEKGIGLVDCLKHIQRSSSVSDYERQYWSQHAENFTTLPLPGISKQRLPVHPLLFSDSSSAWKILTPELNERSATRLVPVARLLSLSINKLYVTAAENFIRAHIDKDTTHQLALTPQRLNDIRELLKEVDDHRMATAMAKRIAELLPVSTTKVDAYEWCESVSQSWLESLDEVHQDYMAVANMHKNLSACRRHTAIELALHDFKLNGPKLNMLIPTPEKLICALYQHQSVIERFYKPDVKEYPDIHQATDKIAEISAVNIFKLRISISTDLLFSASLQKSGMQDEDVTANLANMKATSILESGARNSASVDEDVIRLLYILSHAQTKQTAKFLLGFAFNRTNQRVTNACRVRGLQCVLQLFDDELIEELTNEKVSAIREKLRILVYLSELESIGFSISGARLQKGDKDGVARSILASPELRHSPRAVRIVAELCREYESWCPETWQMILQQMVSSRQIGYLRHLLPDVCCHAGISSLSCLPSVWQSCVTFPLAAMTPPLNSDETTVALDSYHFLIACPVLLQVDLVGVAKHFVRTDLPLLALGCLLCDPSRDMQSRELATKQQGTIRDQLQLYPQILGQNQILEVLNRCGRRK